MATPQVTDHVGLAQDFLQRSREYLASGDLHQASEKAWGAASHIMKAVAAANGWEYERHEQFNFVVQNANQRYRLPNLRNLAKSANELHWNYYQRKMFLNADSIREDIGDVEQMVGIMVPFLMDD